MRQRLLLIEDDASIARFVELAVEELPGEAVELVVARSLAEARDALQAGGWHLVISDLMLPDGSAETLLAEGLARRTDAPPWVVFSAGVHEEHQRALAAHGVARTLRKPVPLAELLATVAELLGQPAAPAAAPDTVARHFGGDRAMYASFRAGCVERFAADLADGEAAVAAGDAAALRRVAHGLKAVLELIGEPALAERAAALEAAAAQAAPGWPAGWPMLAQGLATLEAAPPG
jgi:CheY-like chemotaxis protein